MSDHKTTRCSSVTNRNKEPSQLKNKSDKKRPMEYPRQQAIHEANPSPVTPSKNARHTVNSLRLGGTHSSKYPKCTLGNVKGSDVATNNSREEEPKITFRGSSFYNFKHETP